MPIRHTRIEPITLGQNWAISIFAGNRLGILTQLNSSLSRKISPARKERVAESDLGIYQAASYRAHIVHFRGWFRSGLKKTRLVSSPPVDQVGPYRILLPVFRGRTRRRIKQTQLESSLGIDQVASRRSHLAHFSFGIFRSSSKKTRQQSYVKLDYAASYRIRLVRFRERFRARLKKMRSQSSSVLGQAASQRNPIVHFRGRLRPRLKKTRAQSSRKQTRRLRYDASQSISAGGCDRVQR